MEKKNYFIFGIICENLYVLKIKFLYILLAKNWSHAYVK